MIRAIIIDDEPNAVGLLAAADAWPRELSGGMARRNAPHRVAENAARD